jgi:ribosome-associated protein
MAAITIPKSEFDFSYARGSGPGGQNVNKVNSKAILRWRVTTSPSLPDDVRARFIERYGNRITGDGDLVVTSHVYRDQPRNTADCIRRVQEMVDSVAEPPKAREATEPTAASKVRRIEDKKRDSRKKQDRRMSRVDY